MKALIGIMPLFISTLVFALPVQKGEYFRVQIKDQYIVKAGNQKLNHKIKKKVGKDLFLIETSNKSSLLSYEKVYPNYQYFGDYKESNNMPNDANFSKQFHHNMIETVKAWDITKGIRELVVAVTDNEFQIDHKDLQTTWWTNPNEIPDNNIDDDQNGYVDDVYGWDFIGKDNDVDATEESTHGTHVSGIIAATANNTLGGTGIAPGVRVMPLRWYGEEGSWTSAVIAETYRYAVDMGASIITTSYNVDGLVDDELYLDTIKYIRDNDILLFNSAGNSGQKDPARQKLEEVILVCSVKSKKASDQDKKSSFSNYGTGIDICAPGDPIYSTIQNWAWGNPVQDKYGELQGTSMAAPAAAAVAALIWSANPNFTDEEVRQRLYDSADNIDSKNSRYQGQLGAGRINAYSAVK